MSPHHQKGLQDVHAAVDALQAYRLSSANIAMRHCQIRGRKRWVTEALGHPVNVHMASSDGF